MDDDLFPTPSVTFEPPPLPRPPVTQAAPTPPTPAGDRPANKTAAAREILLEVPGASNAWIVDTVKKRWDMDILASDVGNAKKSLQEAEDRRKRERAQKRAQKQQQANGQAEYADDSPKSAVFFDGTPLIAQGHIATACDILGFAGVRKVVAELEAQARKRLGLTD